MKKRLLVSVLAGSCCGLLFGYDIGAISSATPDLRTHFALSAPAIGIAVSSALFGTIAGLVVAGFATNSIDRRGALLVSGLLYVIASLGTAFASTSAQFVVFRFVGGIAIGLISAATPLYLAVIAPAHMRRRLLGSFQINISVDVVLGFAMGYFLLFHSQHSAAWRYSLAFGAVLALVCESLLLEAVPSPRWLALKRRFAEADDSLSAPGSADPETDQQRPADPVHEFRGLRQAKLFSHWYTRPILLAASIAIFNQFTGVNALLYHILEVFTELGSGRLNGRKDAILVAAFSLLLTMVAVSAIDKVGRKPLLLAGAAGMGDCLIALLAVRYMAWSASSVIIILLCYSLFFAFSPGTVIRGYLSEIFPLPVRARGQKLRKHCALGYKCPDLRVFPGDYKLLWERSVRGPCCSHGLTVFVVLFLYSETKHTSLELLASGISDWTLTRGSD